MSHNLTVVIPSRTISNLIPCVEALLSLDSCRVIVVWDRSRGNHWTPVSDIYEVLPVDADFNFARNCNAGIRAADPDDDIILLNDDALLCSQSGFSRMQSLAQQVPQVGIIGAVTNWTGQPLQHPQYLGLREVPHFAFVSVLIPRRTIDAVGLLDERYCIDYGVEDNDYCEAVKRAGLKIAVYDGCFVDHQSLISTYRGSPQGHRSFAENKKLFCQKWGVTTW